MNRLPVLFFAVLLCTSLNLLASPALCKAAVKGDLAKVKALIARGDVVNAVDEYGWSPLMWAVYYNTLPVTEYLLEQGADPNIEARRGYGPMEAGATALTITGYYNLEPYAALLLKKGAKADHKDRIGKTAYDYAKKYEFTEIMELLKSYSPAVTSTSSGTGASIKPSGLPATLSEAVLTGELELVQLKLQASPQELNQIDHQGWSPLLWATVKQYTPIVRYLIEQGANPNIAAENSYWVNKYGQTPLIISGYQGTTKIAKILLTAKPDLNAKDSRGETALSYAKKFGFTEMVELLTTAAQEQHK